MTIYVDIVFLENLCMNYIILFATAYILKVKRNHIRLIISSAIGAVYSILAYMQIIDIYSNTFMKILLSILMVYTAYNAKNLKIMLKQVVIFYLTTFVFGGCAFALLYFIKPEEIFIKNGMLVGTYPLKIAILGAIVGFVITVIAFKIVKFRLRKKDMYCELTIFLNEKQIKTIGLIDTGNMLKDPISNMPVIVVQKDILKGLIPEEILNNLEKILGGDIKNSLDDQIDSNYISKFRIIPFSTIGKQNGMLLGFKASKVIIDFDENEKSYEKVVIGIYDKCLSKKQNYFALLGLDLIERSDL